MQEIDSINCFDVMHWFLSCFHAMQIPKHSPCPKFTLILRSATQIPMWFNSIWNEGFNAIVPFMVFTCSITGSADTTGKPNEAMATEQLPMLAPTSINDSRGNILCSCTSLDIHNNNCNTRQVGRNPRDRMTLIILIPFFKSWSVCPTHIWKFATSVVCTVNECLQPINTSPPMVRLDIPVLDWWWDCCGEIFCCGWLDILGTDKRNGTIATAVPNKFQHKNFMTAAGVSLGEFYTVNTRSWCDFSSLSWTEMQWWWTRRYWPAGISTTPSQNPSETTGNRNRARTRGLQKTTEDEKKAEAWLSKKRSVPVCQSFSLIHAPLVLSSDRR